MPLYEYQCSKCDKIFEVRQKFSDPPVTVHEGCGGSVVRLLSAPAFQLKGSGWYATDYPKSGGEKKKGDTASNGASDSKGAESKSGESQGGESKSGESKSESKPAASESKSESKPAASTTKKD
jgi:putative FmdB family regulatory protein